MTLTSYVCIDRICSFFCWYILLHVHVFPSGYSRHYMFKIKPDGQSVVQNNVGGFLFLFYYLIIGNELFSLILMISIWRGSVLIYPFIVLLFYSNTSCILLSFIFANVSCVPLLHMTWLYLCIVFCLFFFIVQLPSFLFLKTMKKRLLKLWNYEGKSRNKQIKLW